ncbi:hypothetical protein ACFYT3_12555 [Nocardia amikacinitolerans]|uniref:hypothetical protein n=1 Tax=Nocardia amikacinitolerans TaxID=756689 RepID=UPI0036D0655C
MLKATCFARNLVTAAMPVFAVNCAIALTARCPRTRTATRVAAIAAAWTAGAVGGKSHAAAISNASMASELMMRIFVYWISVASASAASATRSRTSAKCSSDSGPWSSLSRAVVIASTPSPHG